MADDRPTEPLHGLTGRDHGSPGPSASARPVTADAGGTGCRHGHRPTRSPAVHPELGYVPSRSNTWFGVAVYAVVLAVGWWLLPSSWWPWLLAALLLGLVVSGAVQALLGHRGRCWLRRTLRWTFGVIGALVDPVDSD